MTLRTFTCVYVYCVAYCYVAHTIVSLPSYRLFYFMVVTLPSLFISGKTVEMPVGEAVAAGIIDNETLGYYMTRTQMFMLKAGVNRTGLRFRQHLKSERAHYGMSSQRHLLSLR